jgi:hypothetical protein
MLSFYFFRKLKSYRTKIKKQSFLHRKRTALKGIFGGAAAIV